MNLLSRIIDFLEYDLPQGIQNWIDYAPIIWDTREWDSEYLYKLMVFKMRRMEKSERQGPCYNSKKVAKQIKKAYSALDRVVHWEEIKSIDKNLKLFTDCFYKYSLGWWN